jgi:hypothetical protein
MEAKSCRVRSHAIEAIARGAPPLDAIKISALRNSVPHTRPDVDLAALDGLRAVACLAVICFHALLYWGALLPLDVGTKARQ